MRCRPAIIAPNLVELEILCGHPVASVSEAVAAARELIAGPEVVLVKHLARAGLVWIVLRCCW